MTVLTPGLDNNSTGRTRVVADMLAAEFDVEVFGFGSVDRLWPPLKAEGWQPAGDYRFHSWISRRRAIARLAGQVRGDVIYCIKPLPASFGVGLRLAALIGRPLMLDIDDWELGFLSRSALWELRFLKHRWWLDPLSPFYTRLFDSLTHKAAAITVSNSLLQGLYGGSWVPHARDLQKIDGMSPAPPSRVRTVLFAGSAKMHKGMKTLAEAWPLVRRPGVQLKILGTRDAGTDAAFGTQDKGNVVLSPAAGYDTFIAALRDAAVVVVPQENARESIGQLPMKLLDAMAVGAPIVASDVGDIPRWLQGGGGITVTPGDPQALATAIQRMLDDDVLAKRCGEIARQTVMAFGSNDVVGRRLRGLVRAVLNGQTAEAHEPAFYPARATEPDSSRSIS